MANPTQVERREEMITITANTTTNGDYVFLIRGEYEVDIVGTFDSATVNYYAFTSQGRGGSVRTAATAAETFVSNVQNLEIAVTGGGGSLALFAIATPINN